MKFFSINQIMQGKSGGKAQNLAILSRAGVSIPPTLVSETLSVWEWALTKNQTSFKSEILELSKSANWLNKKIIIRSSAEAEDSSSSSSAGIFNSVTLELRAPDFLDKFQTVFNFEGLNISDSQKLTLIIQPYIDCLVSGVTFTANPVTGATDKILFECTSGHLSSILSDGVQPDTISLERGSANDSVDLPSYLPDHLFLKVRDTIQAVKDLYSIEIDIEWAVDDEEEVYVLQARPIVFPSTKLFKVSQGNVDLIPNVIRSNPKIDLRLQAENNNIHMSPAWISISSPRENTQEYLKNVNFEKSSSFSGFSTVLIWPPKVSGETKRAFVGKKNFAASAFKHCRRYTVRDFPPYEKVHDSIYAMDRLSFSTNAFSISIIQTIYRAKYTGIVQKFSDKIFVELAYGHFVPKGIVDTQKFIFSDQLKLLNVDYGGQTLAYEIIEGSIVDCKLDEVRKIDPKEVEEIIGKFEPILKPGTLIEFGRLSESSGSYNELYLIDLVETDSNKETSFDPNIIAAGPISGKVVMLKTESKEAFHSHLNTDFGEKQNATDNEKIVYVSEYPDISLAKHLVDIDPKSVSFVFHHGSILCHLAVLLREGGFAARILSDSIAWKEGQLVELK